MGSKMRWLDTAADLGSSLRQAQEEGRVATDWTALREEVAHIAGLPEADPQRDSRAFALTDHLESLPISPTQERDEPSTWQAILAARPEGKIDTAALMARAQQLDPSTLHARIHGAWIGRCAGCLLGQPIEGWRQERILGLLQATDNYPIRSYISSDIGEELRTRFGVVDHGAVYGSNRKNWINNVTHAPEDDDTNYTVLALKLFEGSGAGFASNDMAQCWLMNMPLLHACTAERVAYVNLSNGLLPPESASRRNPFREWIGAQIRGDFFGYVNPGNPQAAAAGAFKDAAISHVKNGIYGELFVAAMIAAAAVESDPERLVVAGLSQVPAGSRLALRIGETLATWRNGAKARDLTDAVQRNYHETNPFDWCHVIPNAIIVTASLLGGAMDFTRAIGIAVEAGFDTDCNAATVGSIVGMALGVDAIPTQWRAPLADRLKSGIDGYDLPKISELAAKTTAFATRAHA